ncbi:hypothetical protein POM88_028730 [Heracleum sosnowskyi]|uniref:Uncharacterized protein n=1 Tax=Heracleum sosnowskyi TaxID=360622 RepID=A0AAD8HU61_9APIA|nr:hypothetical protein POM88_028730 [Heracleum sosnowskyi]
MRAQNKKYQFKGSKGYKEKSRSKAKDEHNSRLSRKVNDIFDGGPTDGGYEGDTSKFTKGKDEYEEKNLKNTLENPMIDKGPQLKPAAGSPLPRSYMGVEDLKLDGATDSVEYLSHLTTKMKVYEVKGRTRHHLFTATLKDKTHQWFR